MKRTRFQRRIAAERDRVGREMAREDLVPSFRRELHGAWVALQWVLGQGDLAPSKLTPHPEDIPPPHFDDRNATLRLFEGVEEVPPRYAGSRHSGFSGVDRATAPPGDWAAPAPITEESLAAAAELIRIKLPPGPYVEFHHPECPKVTSSGERACRCGTAPLEAAFEDDLLRRQCGGEPQDET